MKKEQERLTEWEYVYNERLGLICEDREPTDEEDRFAQREAYQHLKELR